MSFEIDFQILPTQFYFEGEDIWQIQYVGLLCTPLPFTPHIPHIRLASNFQYLEAPDRPGEDSLYTASMQLLYSLINKHNFFRSLSDLRSAPCPLSLEDFLRILSGRSTRSATPLLSQGVMSDLCLLRVLPNLSS
jgi:hypothetical protein